jgi:triphosphoribosyl-dephospho-CoA synthase
VAREHGSAVAEGVRARAETFRSRTPATGNISHLLPDLMTWDTALKERGINPGTSADLTVATLFVRHIRSILPRTRNSD